jgi:hypothetical protein
MAQYYKELKDTVKDKIARLDRPEDLKDIIKIAIRIDNRIYKQVLEKKGSYIPFKSNKQKILALTYRARYYN